MGDSLTQPTQAIPFPEHMLLIGRTGSGKSSLVGEILSNIDQLYHRHTKDNIVVILSPHECEDSIAHKIGK